jgi:aspartate carbamoyltransferase regulatory subunit
MFTYGRQNVGRNRIIKLELCSLKFDQIKRIIILGKAAIVKLTKIIKNFGVSTKTKVKLVQPSQKSCMDLKAGR